MNPKLSTLLVAVMIATWQTKIIKGADFLFLAEDADILQDCDNEPDYLGAKDFVDLSDLRVEVSDDSVHIEGSIKMVWKADPNDRVEVRTDVFKYDRGSWQPTVFTLIERDFCLTLFDEQAIWFKSWIQFIAPDDRKCLNNKGVIYHHTPFDLKTVFSSVGEDVSGRHKFVVKVDAYNEQNEKQPYSACFQIPGDITKLSNDDLV